MKSKWYKYDQNNSGGSFDTRGRLAMCVIIEAFSEGHSDSLAKNFGIYFDDDCEIDCSCCGSRWYSPEEFDSINDITIGGLTINQLLGGESNYYTKDISVSINYLDGINEKFEF